MFVDVCGGGGDGGGGRVAVVDGAEERSDEGEGGRSDRGLIRRGARSDGGRGQLGGSVDGDAAADNSGVVVCAVLCADADGAVGLWVEAGGQDLWAGEVKVRDRRGRWERRERHSVRVRFCSSSLLSGALLLLQAKALGGH